MVWSDKYQTKFAIMKGRLPAIYEKVSCACALETASCALLERLWSKIRLELQMMGAGMRLSLFVSVSYGDVLRRACGDLDKMQTKTARKKGADRSPHPQIFIHCQERNPSKYKDSDSYSISKSLMRRSITLPGLSPRSLWISWRMSLVWRLTEMTICTLLVSGSAGLRPAPGLAPPLLSFAIISPPCVPARLFQWQHRHRTSAKMPFHCRSGVQGHSPQTCPISC